MTYIDSPFNVGSVKYGFMEGDISGQIRLSHHIVKSYWVEPILREDRCDTNGK